MKPDQAQGLRERAAAPARNPLVAIASGKGGVGKTNLTANLAVAAAGLGARVLAVDGDLGLSNLDVLLGLAPPRSVADVIEGRCALEEALFEGPRGVRILPAAGGRAELAALAGARLEALVSCLWRASAAFDLVLVDAGAGIGPAVVGLACASARVLLVTTPEPTAFADAYATLKVLRQARPSLGLELLVNEAPGEIEARRTHARLERMSQRFLGSGLAYAGELPSDPRLALAVAQQRAVVEAFPNAPVTRRLVRLAARLVREVAAGEGAPDAVAGDAPQSVSCRSD
jgi:flagellar biosynthesis protein FlhG